MALNQRWAKRELDCLKQWYSPRGPKYCSRYIDKTRYAIIKKAKRLGLKHKKTVIQLFGNKVTSFCYKHGESLHYYNEKRIGACVECLSQWGKNRPRTNKDRERDKLKQRRYRSTELGRLKQNLRTLLWHALKNTVGSFRHLSYSPTQFVSHINSVKAKQYHMCPGCNRKYEDVGFTIDHIIPISRAENDQEVIALFDLENLSLLCRNCNSRKGIGELTYV